MNQNDIIEKALRQCDQNYSKHPYAWSETGYHAMAEDLEKELLKMNYKLLKIIPYENERGINKTDDK
jgi:hypothetical protein